MSLPLQGVRVLLVEDDPIIGLDLAATLQAAGGRVFGPAFDAPCAIALLERSAVDVGVLDHLILGGESTPVADLLEQRKVPFLFHTSYRGALAKLYPSAPILDKPSQPGHLVRALQRLLARGQ
jgi:CheY-like chemotaxis protein